MLVPAPRHTPGLIIAFIATSSGRRRGLIGDIARQSEGVDYPAEKLWTVDDNEEPVRGLLVHLRQLNTTDARSHSRSRL